MRPIEDNPFALLELAQMAPDKAMQRAADMIRREAESGKDSAPSSRGSTLITPLTQLDVVSSRFDVTRIPLSRLRQMRRDPMIAFVLFFIYAHLLSAKWRMVSTNAQAAAFADNALRQIYADFIGTYLEKLSYGYQAAIKRFAATQPDWVYVDPADPTNEKPVWSNGSIQALVWKPFIGLPPEASDPIWDQNDGSFAGIKYTPSLAHVSTSGDTDVQEFDVAHSLWHTNDKQSVHGSLWGYPRIGYAYRFWWSFWFNWGLADRHFEKDADPPVKVWFPADKPAINGQSMREIAISIGDRARSNSTIALPSNVIETADARSTGLREWDVEFIKGGGNFDVFEQRFNQLQMFITRACMAPDQAFTAKGGTAGYRSTSNLLEAFQFSQASLMMDIDSVVNDLLLPQLLFLNGFQGVSVRKETYGFNPVDTTVANAILTGVAQAAPESLHANMTELLDYFGIPTLNTAQIADKQQQIATQSVQVKPPPTPANPTTQQAGVTPQGLYYNARERIDLDFHNVVDTINDETFLAEMAVGPLKDDMVLMDATRLRGLWRAAIASDYQDAAQLLQTFDGTNTNLDETFFQRWIRRANERAQGTVATTRRVMTSIMRRARTIEFEKAGLTDFTWDPNFDDAAVAYMQERGAAMVSGVSETTRKEISAYLAELQERGIPKEHMPALVSSKFAMFGEWRADRLVRTEISMAYNMGALIAAKAAGVQQAQCIDGIYGPPRSDQHCIDRSGKVFTIDEAINMTLTDEHPNGTLHWRLLATPTTKKSLPLPDETGIGAFA